VIAYTVLIELDDTALAADWERWLRETHVADVVAAGALDGEVLRLDGSPIRLECRYHFSSRDAFARYQREHAPRLRAEGLARVPKEGAVRFSRSVGDVVVTR
jgi:hypothetical protein